MPCYSANNVANTLNSLRQNIEVDNIRFEQVLQFDQVLSFEFENIKTTNEAVNQRPTVLDRTLPIVHLRRLQIRMDRVDTLAKLRQILIVNEKTLNRS